MHNTPALTSTPVDNLARHPLDPPMATPRLTADQT